MDNYRFYLSARVLLNKTSYRVHSLGASFDSGADLDICSSWYGLTHVLRLSSSSKCGILLSVFVLVVYLRRFLEILNFPNGHLHFNRASAILPLQRLVDGLTSNSVTYLILPNGYLHFIRPSAILPLQGAADGPTGRSHTAKYLWIMTASCQITCAIPWLPCKQLPYLPEYPRISRIRRRDKSDLPLPVLSYK